MLKKSITFDDLDGNSVSEDFYFNFTKAELAEMKLSYDGGLETYLAEIGQKEKQSEVIPAFKMILRKTVGRRHEDGRQFIKTDAIADYFMQTEAYSELFMELLTNPGQMAKFIEGCMPKDLVAEAKKQGAFDQLTGVTVVQDVPLDVVTVQEARQSEALGHPVVKNVTIDEVPSGLIATGDVVMDLSTVEASIDSHKAQYLQEKADAGELVKIDRNEANFQMEIIPATVKKLNDYTEGELSVMPIQEFRQLIDDEKGTVSKAVLVIAMRRDSEK